MRYKYLNIKNDTIFSLIYNIHHGITYLYCKLIGERKRNQIRQTEGFMQPPICLLHEIIYHRFL